MSRSFGGDELSIPVRLDLSRLASDAAEAARVAARADRGVRPGGGVRDNAVAAEKRRLAEIERERKRAADSEARAFRQQQEAENRQRRESARIAAALYRDGERERKRLLAEEAKAVKSALDAETRQRKEAARIAAAIYKDQERAARERERNITQLGSYEPGGGVASGLGGLGATAASFVGNLASSAVVAALSEVRRLLDAMLEQFQAFVSRGLTFNQTLETSRRSIGALLATYYDFRDAQGNVLQGSAALDAAFGASTKVIEELRVAAARTPLTFEELLGALQQVVAAVGGTGIEIEQLVPLTTSLAGAVKTLGLDAKQVKQEVRGLLTGDIGVDTSLARALNINKKMVDEWRAQGTLVDELNRRLQYFNLTAARSAEDLDVLVSNLGDTYDLLAQQATEKTFGRVKEMVARLAEGLLDPVTARLRPEIQAIVDFIDRALTLIADRALDLESDAIRGLQDFGRYIADNREKLLDTVDATLELVEQLALLVEAAVDLQLAMSGVDRSALDAGKSTSGLLNVVRGLATGVALVRDLFESIANTIRLIRALVSIVGDLMTGSMALALQALIGRTAYLSNLLEQVSARITHNLGLAGQAIAGIGTDGADQTVRDLDTRTGTATKIPREGGVRGTAKAATGAAAEAKAKVDQVAEGLERINERLEDYANRTAQISEEARGQDTITLKLKQEALELERAIADWEERGVKAGRAGVAIEAAGLRTKAENLLLARKAAYEGEEGLKQVQAYQKELLAAGRIPIGDNVKQLGPPLIGAAADAKLLAFQLGRIYVDVTNTYSTLKPIQQQQLINLRSAELIADQAERRARAEAEILQFLSKQTEVGGFADVGLPGGVQPPTFDPDTVNVPVPDAQRVTQSLGEISSALFQAVGGWNALGNAAGAALGGILSGTQTAGEAIRGFVFNLLGDVLIAFGNMLIAVGAGLSTVPFLFGLSGGAAIAAGVAAIAVGSAFKALAGGAGGSGAAPAAGGAGTSSTSNVTPIEEGRRRRNVRGGEFNTSGESTERRPLSFFGTPGGARDNLRLDIDMTVTTDKDSAVQHFVSKLNRGSVRQQVKKKLSA